MFGFSTTKITIYLIVIFSIITLVTATYFSWKHKIEAEALVKYNNIQIEQNIKDNKKYLDLQLNIDKSQSSALKDVTDQNKVLDDKIDQIDKSLDKPLANTKPKIASKVIRDTLEQLNNLNDKGSVK